MPCPWPSAAWPRLSTRGPKVSSPPLPALAVTPFWLQKVADVFYKLKQQFNSPDSGNCPLGLPAGEFNNNSLHPTAAASCSESQSPRAGKSFPLRSPPALSS